MIGSLRLFHQGVLDACARRAGFTRSGVALLKRGVGFKPEEPGDDARRPAPGGPGCQLTGSPNSLCLLHLMVAKSNGQKINVDCLVLPVASPGLRDLAVEFVRFNLLPWRAQVMGWYSSRMRERESLAGAYSELAKKLATSVALSP